MRRAGTLRHDNGMGTKGLTTKQRMFIGEYLKDGNATQAAIRAGYSKHSAMKSGLRNTQNVQIMGEIAALQTDRHSSNILTYEEACEILSEIARGNGMDYLDDDGRISIPKLKRINPRAVQALDSDNATGRKAHPIMKMKLRDPVTAIERLSKLRGWDHPEQHDVSVTDSTNAKSRLADLLARRHGSGNTDGD